MWEQVLKLEASLDPVYTVPDSCSHDIDFG